MLLYKFCPPRRIDILRTGMIALTQPRAFNDPFELRPHISKVQPGEIDQYLLERTQQFVVLSLAENCESLLMWAHYTEAYRGFLIGFEGPDGILESESQHRDHGPVFYCHHRPSHSRFKDFGDHELLYTKSSEWAYEREWRIIDSLFSADGEAIGRDKNSWPFRFRPESVKSVIAGYRSADLVSQLIPILRQPQYQHVTLSTAYPDYQKFALLFDEHDRGHWDELV